MTEGLIPKFKSKITFQNKAIVGIVSIILGIIFWAIAHEYVGLIDYLIIMIPAIILIIPSETTKNSKILGIITGLIIIVMVVLCIGALNNPGDLITYSGAVGYWDPYEFDMNWNYEIAQIVSNYSMLLIYGIINLFCVLLFFIETPKFNEVIVNNNDGSYCHHCGSKILNDAVFCSKCGKKI